MKTPTLQSRPWWFRSSNVADGSEPLRTTAYPPAGAWASPCGSGSRRFAPGIAPAIAAVPSPATHVSVGVTIPDAGRRGRSGEFRPGALGPASRLRRRDADASAGAPRGARSALAGAGRRVQLASRSKLLASLLLLDKAATLRVWGSALIQTMKSTAHDDGQYRGGPSHVYRRKSGETAAPNSVCLRMRPTSRAALIGAGSF
jgi:hypothetical protein